MCLHVYKMYLDVCKVCLHVCKVYLHVSNVYLHVFKVYLHVNKVHCTCVKITCIISVALGGGSEKLHHGASDGLTTAEQITGTRFWLEEFGYIRLYQLYYFTSLRACKMSKIKTERRQKEILNIYFNI